MGNPRLFAPLLRLRSRCLPAAISSHQRNNLAPCQLHRLPRYRALFQAANLAKNMFARWGHWLPCGAGRWSTCTIAGSFWRNCLSRD